MRHRREGFFSPTVNTSEMDDIDAQMLQTLEILHYCQRFADKLFAFCFERSHYCEELLMDLRVLHAARIRQILFCAADPGLQGKLELWNRSGYKFLVLEADTDTLQTAAFIGRLQQELSDGNIPFVALTDFATAECDQILAQKAIMHCAVCLGAAKVFFPGEQPGCQLDGRLRSYPTSSELRGRLGSQNPFQLLARPVAVLSRATRASSGGYGDRGGQAGRHLWRGVHPLRFGHTVDPRLPQHFYDPRWRPTCATSWP